jgi:hypothetical protein
LRRRRLYSTSGSHDAAFLRRVALPESALELGEH